MYVIVIQNEEIYYHNLFNGYIMFHIMLTVQANMITETKIEILCFMLECPKHLSAFKSS